MITLQLAPETVQFIYEKLDQVGNTRNVCNFLQHKVEEYHNKMKQAQESQPINDVEVIEEVK